MNITLHIYTDIKISKQTQGGLVIRSRIYWHPSLLAATAHSTHEPRPPACDTFWVTPKLFLSHLLLSLYGEVIKQTEVQHAHNCSRLLDEKYFQHERNPQSIQKTIYQKTLNIVATVGLEDDRMTQYFGWRWSPVYKRSTEANIPTMRTHLRRISSHEKYLIHTKNILHSELTWPHSLILALATCLMATLSPSLLRMPAYTIPKPPFPRTGPTWHTKEN